MGNTPPAETLRDGNLKATIWENETDKGRYFSTKLSRSYKDDQGEYKETQSFFPSDLLRVSELARQAYNRTIDLKREPYKDQDRVAELQARQKEKRDSLDPSQSRER